MSAVFDDGTSKSQEGSTPESSPSSSEDELPRTSGEFEQMNLNAPGAAGQGAAIESEIQQNPGQLTDTEVTEECQQNPRKPVDSVVAAMHHVPEELQDSDVTGKQIPSEPEGSVVARTGQILPEPLDSGVSGTKQQMIFERLGNDDTGESQTTGFESVDRCIVGTSQIRDELVDSLVAGTRQIISEPMAGGVPGTRQQRTFEPVDGPVAGESLSTGFESVDSGAAGTIQITSEPVDSGAAGTIQITSEPVDSGAAGTIQITSEPVDSGAAGTIQITSEPVDSGSAGTIQITSEPVDSGAAGTRQISEPVHRGVAATCRATGFESVDRGDFGPSQIRDEPADTSVAGSSRQTCEESVDQTAKVIISPNDGSSTGTSSFVKKDYPSAEDSSHADSKPGPSTLYLGSIPADCASRKYKRGTHQIPSTSTDGRTFLSEETPTADVGEWDDGSPSSSDYQKYPLKDVASSFMFGGSCKQPYPPDYDSTSSEFSEIQNQVVHRPDDEGSQRSEQSLDEMQDVEEQRVDSSDTTGSSGIQIASRRPILQDNNAVNAVPRGHQAYLDALMEEAEQRGDQSTSSGIFSTDPEDQGMAQAQAWMVGIYAPRQRVEGNQPAASPRHTRGQSSSQHPANITSSSDPDSAEDNRKSCIDLAEHNVPIDSEQRNIPEKSEYAQDETEEQRNKPSTSGCIPSRDRRLVETERETSESPRPGPSQKRITTASSLDERREVISTPKKRAPPRKASSVKNYGLVRSASQSSYESVDPQSSSSGSFSRGHSEEKSSSEPPESSESTKLVTRRIWQKSGFLQSMQSQTLSSRESIEDEEAYIDESVKVQPEVATASAQVHEKTGDGDHQIQPKDKMDDSKVQCSNEASSSKTSRRSRKGRGSRKGKAGSKSTPKKKLQSSQNASASISLGTAAAIDASPTASTKSIESVGKPRSEEERENASASEKRVEEHCPKEETTGCIRELQSRSPERSRSAPPEKSPRNPKNRPDSCDF